MFDAMSIKKQGLWDEKIGKFIGNCVMGNALEIEDPTLQQLKH